MKLTCIHATKNDLKLLNDLMRRSKAYWGYDDVFMNKFMYIFQMTSDYFDKNDVKLCVEKDSLDDHGNVKIIGFYSFSTDNDGNIEVDNFFIDPDVIGKGYGKQMWCALLDDIKAHGKTTMTLWSDPGAEGFYKKMGCMKIGVKKSPMMPDRYPVIFQYYL